MNVVTSEWVLKSPDHGREILAKTVKLHNLRQSYACAYAIAEALVGSEAEKDFSVSADPMSVFIVLHAYNKGPVTTFYTAIAEQLDKVIDDLRSDILSNDSSSKDSN